MTCDVSFKIVKLAEGNEFYAAFNRRIVNTKMPVIGVRVPDLRRLARRLAPDMGAVEISELLTAQNESFDYVLLCGLLITHARLDDQTAIDLISNTCRTLIRGRTLMYLSRKSGVLLAKCGGTLRWNACRVKLSSRCATAWFL